MKIDINSDLSLALIVAVLAITGAAGTILVAKSDEKIKVECFKTQQVAIAASSPDVPKCRQ